MQIKDIMTGPVVTVDLDVNLDEAARIMLSHRIGCVVVVDANGKACGILTERDFTAQDAGNPFDPYRAPSLFGKNVRRHGLAAIYEEARAIPARKAMRSILYCLAEDDAVERAMDLMVRHEINHLPVLHGWKPVGMVSRHDLLRLVFQTPQTVTA
ncbi:MAG: CBS domain-containing protein [bacterium]